MTWTLTYHLVYHQHGGYCAVGCFPASCQNYAGIYSSPLQQTWTGIMCMENRPVNSWLCGSNLIKKVLTLSGRNILILVTHMTLHHTVCSTNWHKSKERIYHIHDLSVCTVCKLIISQKWWMIGNHHEIAYKSTQSFFDLINLTIYQCTVTQPTYISISITGKNRTAFNNMDVNSFPPTAFAQINTKFNSLDPRSVCCCFQHPLWLYTIIYLTA